LGVRVRQIQQQKENKWQNNALKELEGTEFKGRPKAEEVVLCLKVKIRFQEEPSRASMKRPKKNQNHHVLPHHQAGQCQGEQCIYRHD
jgi:RNA recognition motif-containing protein